MFKSDPHEVVLQTKLPFDSRKVFDWHLRAHAIDRFLPPMIQLIKAGLPSQIGSEVFLRMHLGPFATTCIFEHTSFKDGESFTDSQKKGLFQKYEHLHKAIPINNESSIWEDRVTFFSYGLSSWIEKKLRSYLKWRHARLLHDLTLFYRYPFHKKRILVSGASGFIGKELVSFLKVAGHEVVLLRRSFSKKEGTVGWDPEKEWFEKNDFEGFDAIIHLAGENIASGLWTKKKKERLFTTRCRSTWLLAKIISRLDKPPKQFICASAVGFYGDRPGEVVDEQSKKGEGFLSDLCESWEKASDFLSKTKVVHTRFGMILGHQGGVLPRLLKPIKLGLGIVIGKGDQMVSWISIDDAVGAIYHILHKDIEGPVLVTSPNAVSQQGLIENLAAHYQKTRILHLGNFFGEMGRELFLASCASKPSRLMQTGYSFLEPRLEDVIWDD